MRAQASAESLVVFLVFISILGIAALAISRIGDAAKTRLDSATLQSSMGSLSYAISQACAMGGGNVRQVRLSSAATLSTDGKKLRLSSGNSSLEKDFNCELLPINLHAGSFTISNLDGKIDIS
ncbi:MAG: hypothetical protein NT051_00120 [Candidatus Micrarchaeota archaeon]|nr:hypothetical protein [Candidatus Micrarchaeota archaeon]